MQSHSQGAIRSLRLAGSLNLDRARPLTSVNNEKSNLRALENVGFILHVEKMKKYVLTFCPRNETEPFNRVIRLYSTIK